MIGTRALFFVMLTVFLATLPGWAGQQKQQPAGAARSGQQDSGTIAPASVEEDIQVGTFYMHKGDTDAAIPRFEDAIRQEPRLGKPRILLAEAYEKKGDKLNAAKSYKEYLQVFPNAADKKKIEKKIETLSDR